MTGEREMVEALTKAFWIALMLTGRIEAAEAAVLDGITAVELDHISGDSLLLATAKSAVQRRTEFPEQNLGLSILPLELRRLFLLAPNYRDCFVLRVLNGLTSELCSGILHLSINEVDDALYTALQELPRIETCDMDRLEIVDSAQDAKVDSSTSTSE
jgi:DNA-directed RNA polymerase specialized sigma24 family protein